MIFHIADNPCHGREYHSGIRDNFPHGDPYGSRRSANSLFGQINQKGIQYFFGKITNATDIMLEKFLEVYNGKIVICDLKDVSRIMDSVVSTTSLAVTRGMPNIFVFYILPNEKLLYTKPNTNVRIFF